MKKLLLLACIPAIVFAGNEIIKLPSKGIEIVPLSKMDVPDFVKKDIAMKMNQEKKVGYFESNEGGAKELLSLRETYKKEIEESKKISDPYDTHLKETLSEIKLAFPFKELSIVNKENILGYSAAGGYVKDKEPSGWTGIGVYFKNNPGQVCSYTFFNLLVSHGAAQLNKENTHYIVNKKPSSTFIEGNYTDGFIYSVKWFDTIGMHEIQCADINFDKNIMKNIIEMANKIDKEKSCILINHYHRCLEN